MKNCLMIPASLLLAGSLFGTGPGDEQAVRKLVGMYAQSREELDPEALGRLFTKDADQLVSSGEWRHGREQLISGMMGSSRRSPGERVITVETVRFVSSDVAIADARYVITGQSGTPDRSMWSSFIAVRTQDGWRLTAIRNMLPAPSN